MADSLQDQLRALGLARDKPATGKKKPARKRGHVRKSKPAQENSQEMTLGKAWALREQHEKRSSDEARRRKQAEDRRRREINQAIRAIIGKHRLNREDAEVARNFMFRGRIRKVYVTAEQNHALAAGEMGLVYLAGGYHLLQAEVLEQVRAISADHVVDLGGADDGDEEFPVPDDITW